MDPGFDVSAPDLAAAARALGKAADQAEEVEVRPALAALGEAMPRSAAADAAQTFATAWEPAHRTWVDRVRSHARALATSAADYVEVDDAVREAMSGPDEAAPR